MPNSQIKNTELNRRKLASEMVEMWDMDTLIGFAVDTLEQSYKNDDTFREVLTNDIDPDKWDMFE